MKKLSEVLIPLVLSTVIVTTAAPLFADEAFTVHIKKRAIPTQEVGMVKVRLELDAAPAGSHLTLRPTGDTVTINGTQTVDGVDVTLRAGPGNAVTVVLEPLTNFGTDFCSGAGAVEKNVLMDFIGPNVSGYRIASYVVGSPAAECSKVSKRVSVSNSGAEILLTADGVVPALVATNKDRLPLDVIFVLDKSGSMSELPPGVGSGPSKMAILHAALDAFMNQWKTLDAGTADDRIGVVSFDSNETIERPDAVHFFIPRGTNPPATHAWNAVITTIDNLSPGSATALGKGINTGMLQWDTDRVNDAFVVVVTDGKQNVAPLVEPAVSGFLALPATGTFNAELRKRFVPIQTIAFGMPVAQTVLLNAIAQETSARNFVPIDTTDMYVSFRNTLIDILKGNTASIAMSRNDTFAGSAPGPLIPVIVDQSAQRVVFSLQWAPPLRDALDLEVFPPGTAPTPNGGGTPPTSRADAPQSTTQGYDLTAAQIGTWNVRVVPRGEFRSTFTVPYTFSALFLERRLDYRVEFDRIHEGTGDQFKVRVEVGYDHAPLHGLPPNAIRAHVQRPNEAFGTILHDTPVDPNVLKNPAPTSGDTTTPYDAKVAALTNGQLIDRIAPKDHSTIALTEESNGVYTGTFSDTSVPGLYRFEFLLDWDDPRTGHVRREERVEREVKVKPNAASTNITVSNAASRGTVLITATPRDKFGNYLGPGFASLVTAKLNSTGTLVSGPPADANQSGDYVFTVTGVPAGEIPDVDVTVDGVNVGNARGTTTTAAGHWRYFLDLGPNFPHGSFSNGVDGKWSLNAGFERLISSDWSVEGIVGYHRFDAPFVSNPHIWQFSVNGKRWFGTGSQWHPFLNAGAGAYRFDPGSTTKLGWNAGGGVLYDVTSTWGVEGVYNYHSVRAGGGDTADFSTVQAGVRIRF